MPSSDDSLSVIRGNFILTLGLLLSTWVLGAFPEELVYRGYLVNRLGDLVGRNLPGKMISVILSAGIFSLAHGRYDLHFLLTAFLAGIIEGWLYFASHKNLWLPIIFHGTTDSLSIILTFLEIL